MSAKRIDDILSDEMRVRIVLGIFLFLFAGLIIALWRVQVAQGPTHKRSLAAQSVRKVRIPGMRGRIYDRNGVCLADNRPSYGVALYLEEHRISGGWSKRLERVQSLIGELEDTLQLKSGITMEAIKNHMFYRRPLPLLVWKDISDVTLARFSEHVVGLPGVDIYVEPLRVYPLGKMACHVMGYVQRADLRDELTPEERKQYNFEIPEVAGKTGIESRLDGLLRGKAGSRLLRIDVFGYRFKDIGMQEPHSGQDVMLSLDSRIQTLAEETLGEAAGAVVVLDPRNGDVLALASTPRYDPNDFIKPLSTEKWNTLINDPDKPLFNKAIRGTYPPGSTFKPVVSLAALKSHRATGETSFTCPGYFQLGAVNFNCFRRHAHGLINLREAIKHSCNVFFFQLGLHIGYDHIYHTAAALGLGKKTGIALNGESMGILPNNYWKMQNMNDTWRPGDTCNLSIGQGPITVTPLQMALIASTIGNGGKVYRPRLLLGVKDPKTKTFHELPPSVVNTMNFDPDNLKLVRRALRDVVMAPDGTGRLAKVDGVDFAGKTGTAEFGLKNQDYSRGWMIAFAPYENPKYAIAILMEKAVSGGVTVAPLMKKMIEGIFFESDKAEG